MLGQVPFSYLEVGLDTGEEELLNVEGDFDTIQKEESAQKEESLQEVSNERRSLLSQLGALHDLLSIPRQDWSMRPDNELKSLAKELLQQVRDRRTNKR